MTSQVLQKNHFNHQRLIAAVNATDTIKWQVFLTDLLWFKIKTVLDFKDVSKIL